MLTSSKKIRKTEQTQTVLRRMRESSDLTMRQAGAMIGISHVAISQFENGKLDLPDYRIEQLVKAYGCKMEDFYKIIGRPLVISPKDDCRAMLDRLSENQLSAVRSILNELLLSQAPAQVAVEKENVIETAI